MTLGNNRTSMLPTPRTSAVIDGKITGRVTVIGPKGGLSRGRKPPRASSPRSQPKPARRVFIATDADVIASREPKARPPKRQRLKRPGTRPSRTEPGFKQLCISVPPPIAIMIDRWADRVSMNRSRFLIAAAKHFAAKIFPDGECP